MARPPRRFSDTLIQSLRKLPPTTVFRLLDCYVTTDTTFEPTKDKSTKLYRVCVPMNQNKYFDLLVTGTLWFDKGAPETQARKGGRDGITLAMYLSGLDFVPAVKLLQKTMSRKD